MVLNQSDFETLRSQLKASPSGSLILNGQVMILIPRHFFRYILREVKAVAGAEAFRRIFEKAGFDGAVTFCRRFREIYACTPREAIEGYLKEMSLRGWGHFTILRLEPDAGCLEVLLQNSALANEENIPSGHLIWEGAMLGAMTFLRECVGQPLTLRVQSEEIPSQGGPVTGCRIVIGPESIGEHVYGNRPDSL